MSFYYDVDKPHDNGFLRFARKITRPLGFYRSYNFILWFIYGGANLGFGAARVQYLDMNGVFAPAKKINADWEHWRSVFPHISTVLHLGDAINSVALVKVDQYSQTNPAEIGMSVNASFVPAGFVALLVHLMGVELYLALTTAERDRLKQFSYEKQLARSMRRPGDSSGLTAQCWGDLPPRRPEVAPKEEGGGSGSEGEGIMKYGRDEVKA